MNRILGILSFVSLSLFSVLFKPILGNNHPSHIPIESLNNNISLSYLENYQSLKTNQSLNLSIEVIGEDTIYFEHDFSVEMYEYQRRKWIPVESIPTTYSSEGYIIFPSEGNPYVIGSTSLNPILSRPNRSTIFRVYVFGSVIKDGTVTDKIEGAFTDVVLHP